MISNNIYNINIAEDITLPKDQIKKIEGVTSVEYNGLERNISITIDNKHKDDAAEILQEIVATVRQSDGKVITENITRPVLNMTCAACASSSQNILSYVPGVVSASVNSVPIDGDIISTV